MDSKPSTATPYNLLSRYRNLERGRVKRYVGNEEKVRTTLSLSKSTREYLSQYGNGMSETIEFLVWVHSGGRAGLVTDKFEMLKDR